MTETRYFMCPVTLIQDAFSNPTKVMGDIIDSSVYQHSLTLNGNDEIQKLKSAAEYFGLTFGDMARSLKNAKDLERRYYHTSTVMVSLNKSIVFDFYLNKKTEWDVACFCGYAATKSILGKKPFIKLTNEFFLARFFGFGSVADLNLHFKNKNIYKKYSTRYALDKLKEELKENWGLKLYGRHTRGFYVSYALDYEELVLYAEKNRKAIKAKQKRREEADILHRVLQRLASDD